jgi:putative transferase (TIGR04331 family)
VFLATTAIEEFWDKNSKIIFLGEWCKLFNRKEEWMLLKYEDTPFVWDNSDTVIDGIKYCDKVYEKTLIELTQILNEYHGINKDTHYYRIVLGNWLICFIHQLYDKYLTLKRTFEEYPDVQTWLLDESQHYIPLEYNDYMEHIVSDKYALELYSQILSASGCNYERKKLSNPLAQQLSYRINSPLPLKTKVFRFFTKATAFVSSACHKKTITITSPNLNSPLNYLSLLLGSRFRYVFDETRYKVGITFNINQTPRKEVLNLNDDEFESILSQILLLNIPILFLEGFAPFRSLVMKLPIHKSDAFFTANALHGNYIFKFFLAEHYKTIKILNGQHGGGYGIDFIAPTEEYEKSVADRFYTAGWMKEAKTIPLAIPKFNPKRFSGCIPSDMIVFTITEMPRYVYRLDITTMSSNYLQKELEQIMVFLKHFKRRDKLLIRTYPQNFYGWDTDKRIAEKFSDCFFDDFSKPFKQRLAETKIFITSSIHTTYLEALAANKPSVIFLNNKVYRFHPDAQPYFERLQDANILHYSPESAAEHLNVVYDDVDTWWQSSEVQNAREAFVKKYARLSPNWADEWATEFNRVLAEC